VESAQKALAKLWAQVRACRRCQEEGFIPRAAPVFSPVVPTRWMLIGQAPGTVEESIGKPFSGRAGSTLFRWLAEAGWPETEFRQTVHITALTRCFPGKNQNGNGDRAPSTAELTLCRPYLEQELKWLEPKHVILVGMMALIAFWPHETLASAVGRILATRGSDWICLPHPSGTSRWLNLPFHQEKLRRALANIRELHSARD
jgi:uracil-DNA glycosylase family 4